LQRPDPAGNAAALVCRMETAEAMLQMDSKARASSQANDHYRNYEPMTRSRQNWNNGAPWVLPTIDGANSPRRRFDTLKDPHRMSKTQFTTENLCPVGRFVEYFAQSFASAGAPRCAAALEGDAARPISVAGSIGSDMLGDGVTKADRCSSARDRLGAGDG